MQSTIRFVGGPWHNRLQHVEIAPSLSVQTAHGIPCGITTLYKPETYYLARYTTGTGTVYHQYVHSSLVRSGRASISTCRERFPAWQINRRRLEAQIRRRMQWKR